jgi:chromosome segregation ATPase
MTLKDDQFQSRAEDADTLRQQIKEMAAAYVEQNITLNDKRRQAEAEQVTLRQQLAEARQEAADWRLSFETSNDHVGQLQAQLAALQGVADPPLHGQAASDDSPDRQG